MSFRLAHPLGIALMAVSLAACSDSTGSETHLGIYDMRSFRGQTLPAGDGTIHVRSGEIELRSGGRFTLEMDRDFCGTGGPCVNDPVAHDGSYALQNGLLSMVTEDGDRLDGRLQPGYIILEDGQPGSLWILRE